MPRSRRSRGSTINIWPGFVDALTQLTMVMVFVLLVFTVGQFYLSGTVSTQDAAIKQLAQQINALNDMLALARQGSEDLTKQKASLEAQLADEKAKSGQDLDAAETTIASLNQNIAALQQQLKDIAAALDLAQKQGQSQQAEIADLGKKLNLALAAKLQELSQFRSEFFGRLKAILGDRSDIRVVGDRFVFQSEVLFDPGSADLDDDAATRLMPVVSALKEIEAEIPPAIDWILEVDGHTDRRPINTAEFHSNWELSTARAVAVVKFLIGQGIPAEHLSAAGFGEWQPLDPAGSEDAYKRNRRIELKLTQR
jgi:chemotaxis protein MotB